MQRCYGAVGDRVNTMAMSCFVLFGTQMRIGADDLVQDLWRNVCRSPAWCRRHRRNRTPIPCAGPSAPPTNRRAGIRPTRFPADKMRPVEYHRRKANQPGGHEPVGAKAPIDGGASVTGIARALARRRKRIEQDDCRSGDCAPASARMP